MQVCGYVSYVCGEFVCMFYDVCVDSHGDSVVALHWHSTQPLISTAALDRIVRLWDARKGILCIHCLLPFWYVSDILCGG